MILSWAENAWEDYLHWQVTDKKNGLKFVFMS